MSAPEDEEGVGKMSPRRAPIWVEMSWFEGSWLLELELVSEASSSSDSMSRSSLSESESAGLFPASVP